MTTSVTLRNATPNDILALIVVQVSAYSTAWWERCFPSSDPKTIEYYRSYIKRTLHEITVACDAHNEIIGWVRWVRISHLEQPGPTPTFSLDMYPPQGHQDLAMRYFKTAYEKRMETVQGKEHWFLSMLMVKKEAQRQGAGTAMMKPWIDRADEDGWMCYVNGSEQGRGLYEKFGFRPVGITTFEPGVVCYHMKRAAAEEAKAGVHF